jgi:hypothetical protein
MPGLLGVGHFCPRRPGEAYKENKEEENAGKDNRGSRQQKIRPETGHQSGYQLEDQVHAPECNRQVRAKRPAEHAMCGYGHDLA